MADSRTASERLIRQMEHVVAGQRRVILFLGSILLSLWLTYGLREDHFSPAQVYVLFLLFFSVCLWVTEAIPPFAVGILVVGYLVFFLGNPEINDPASAEYIRVDIFVHTWSNSVIWLMLGGFFLAEAMKKTGLDKDVFHWTISTFGQRPAMLLLGVMLGTGVASMVMSNTATAAMMIAMIMPLLVQLGEEAPFAKSLLLGIPIAASIGGMGTIIGSPPNAIAVEAINNMQVIGVEVGFLEWMLFGVPIALILIVLIWLVLIRTYVPKVKELDLGILQSVADESEEAWIVREHRLRKQFVLAILGITILLWMTGRVHQIPAAAVSGLPILAFTMLSIITGEDVRKLPWDTLMLVAGGLSLGLAIQKTELALFFVEKLQNIHLSFWLLVVLFSLLTIILSNVMSNTATATILIPVASFLGGSDPLVLPVVIGLSASCALFLPVSTPPNAIAFSTGMIRQSDFRLGGIWAAILGPSLIISWVWLMVNWLWT